MMSIIIKRCLISLCGLYALSFSQEQPLPKAPLEPGTTAPTFSLPTLTGEREALRVWCGQSLLKPMTNNIQHVVILSFWATYCKPCQEEIPQLQAFFEKHKKDKVKIFLISIDEKGADIVSPFAKEKKYSLPILLDPYKKTAERYGVKSLPALFVIDSIGNIRYSSVGYRKEVSLTDVLDKVFTALAKGEPVPVNLGKEKPGESVAIQKDTATKDTVKKQIPDSAQIKKEVKITPKQRWEALARIECGASPDSVAAQLHVPVEEVKKWYQDLRSAAIKLWESK